MLTHVVSEKSMLGVNQTAVSVLNHAGHTSFLFLLLLQCNSIGQRVLVGYDVIISIFDSSGYRRGRLICAERNSIVLYPTRKLKQRL